MILPADDACRPAKGGRGRGTSAVLRDVVACVATVAPGPPGAVLALHVEPRQALVPGDSASVLVPAGAVAVVLLVSRADARALGADLPDDGEQP